MRFAGLLTLILIISGPLTPAHRAAANGGGTIAYVRGGTEIRLIDADGSNDRRLWTHPDAKKELGIFEVAWRPDGKELAFSSGHEAVYSLYHADIYAIHWGTQATLIVYSVRGSLSFGRRYDSQPHAALSILPRHDLVAKLFPDPDEQGDLEWQCPSCGFGFHTRGQPDLQATIWHVPYWSIVIPLTLLSAYLLFRKPRTPKPHSEQSI